MAFAQGREPLNLINYHFKTKILSIGSEGYIGIGLTEKVTCITYIVYMLYLQCIDTEDDIMTTPSIL